MVAIRHDPRNPYQVDFMALLIVAYYFERDYDSAVDAAGHSLARYPKDPRAYRFLAASLAQLGRDHEARDVLQHAMTISPASFDIFVRACPLWWRRENHDHMPDGLRKAGWQSCRCSVVECAGGLVLQAHAIVLSTRRADGNVRFPPKPVVRLHDVGRQTSTLSRPSTNSFATTALR
jgi:hypothetical protein